MAHLPSLGILAYGSLIDDPGDELAAVLIRTIREISTPFSIEFARSSRTRKGAPTLIPVPEGGARVKGAIHVIDATTEQGADMLWRREIRESDRTKRYLAPGTDKPNAVRVGQLQGFAGLDHVLFTEIGANIASLTPERLAALAIESVGQAAAGLDGISYLMAAKANGIATPLSPAYEQEILRRTGAADLAGALARLSACATQPVSAHPDNGRPRRG